LDFLNIVTAHNVTEDSQRDGQDDVEKIQNVPEGEEVTATPVGNEVSSQSTSTYFRRKKAKLEDKLENYMDAMTKRQAVMDLVDDEDFAFFRSLLPNVKRLPIGDKLQFQSDVLHLLINYTNKVQNQQQIGPLQQYGHQQHYGLQQYQRPYQSNPQNVFMAQYPGGANPNVNNPGPSQTPNTFNFQEQLPGSSTFTDNGDNDHVLSSVRSPGNSETSDSLLSLH